MIASIFFIVLPQPSCVLAEIPMGTGLGLGLPAGGAGGWYSEPGTGMNCSG
jgi:hypothetical protein